MSPTNKERDAAILRFMQANAGRELPMSEIREGTGYTTPEIGAALQRLALKDRKIAHPKVNRWLYRGTAPAAAPVPAPPLPFAEAPRGDMAAARVIANAVDKLTDAIERQTHAFTTTGILMR